MMGASDPQTEREFLRTFVGGLPYHCHEEELRLFMERFGSVEQIYISKDPQGQHKGFAFVNFSRLHPGKHLFGEHSFKSKPIEVKLNLLNHLFLTVVPHFVTAADIRTAIESLEFPVASLMLGNGHNGIPLGTCSVKLQDEFQLSNAALIGKIVVKGVVINMEAKTNKFLAIKPIKDMINNKKRCNKKVLQQFHSDKKSKSQYHDFSPTSNFPPLNESELFNSGFMMTATRPSDSEFSMGELRENQEFLSFIGDTKRKMSSPSKNFADVFATARNKIESVELTESDRFNLTSSILYGDQQFPQVPMTRHNSETLTGTSFEAFNGPRRLSSFSSSFYTGNANRQRIARPPSLEVTIAFFTFPGRE